MKQSQRDISKIIKEIADNKEVDGKKGVHPSTIIKSELLASGKVTDWTLRNLGGFDLIKKTFFQVDQKDLAEIQEAREINSYVTKLEKRLGDRDFFQKKIVDAIKQNIKPLPKIRPRQITVPNIKQNREIVMMLNDTHYGLIVNPAEIGEVNSFGWTQACRRSAMMVVEALNYKLHHRDEVKKCHLVLNGDLINGIIHGLTTRQMEQMVFQSNGAIHIFTHIVSLLAKEFGTVEVHGLCGNHEDMPHKREHGKRVTSEKYDSFANIIFYALSTAFRDSTHVKFNFPKTPYLFIDLPAGRAMVTHGDTIFSPALGNPGKSINVKTLSEEIRKFNAGELLKGKAPIKLLLFGHVHSFAHFMTQEGVEIYVAPSLSGTDGYAHGLNINSNVIGQVLFESTDRFIMGDSRLVRLIEADTKKELDNVIPVFNNDLKWKN